MAIVDPHRLVLWDIDLTLIDIRGFGTQWYTRALAEVTGVELRHLPIFPGRTERAITADVLTAHGIEPDEDLVGRMWAKLATFAERDHERIAADGRALPGADAALNALAGQGGIVQTLVTGNLPEVARYKLSAFELHEHIDFEVGGYGSLSAHRPDLVSHAVDRSAAKHSTEFPPESVVVIGDTPHDIDAARAHGAIGIGVATGVHDARTLRDSGAHAVLDDLSDTRAMLAAVLD